MNRFPYHFIGGKRRGRSRDESSIALIVTLAIMSLLLVLVLTFATVTKVEISTATANRDLIQSKFLAQGAFERSMADLIQAYQHNSNRVNDGLEGTWSEIKPAGTNIQTNSVTGVSATFVTDIESVIYDTASGRWVTRQVPDDIVDYVVIPNSQTNYSQGVTPHWIGVRNTNGQLVGRIAYVASGASLCLNAIGNTNASAVGGPTNNTRNQGLSVTELNLTAALKAIGGAAWNNAVNPPNDAVQIIRGRFLPGNLAPGDNLVDDDDNALTNRFDGLDNNGNGIFDEVSEGTDEPNEFLGGSENYFSSPTIVVVSANDQVYTDLKQLYETTGTYISDAAARARFLGNFGSIQRFFSTQSPVAMDPNLINLNDTNYLNNTNAFFTVLTNRFKGLPYPSADEVEQAQLAANIVSYRNTNLANEHYLPVTAVVSGTNVTGVAMVPHINEITYEIPLQVSRDPDGTPGNTNLMMSLGACKVIMEVWYPYTTKFPANAASTTVAFNLRQGVDVVEPNSGAPNLGWQNLASTDVAGVPVVISIPAATVAGCTNASQFRTFTNTFAIPGNYQRPWQLPVNVDLTNFNFKASFTRNAGGRYDELLAYPTFNPVTNAGVLFRYNDITNAITSVTAATLTGYVSIAFNDPRAKGVTTTNWGLQYAGTNTAIAATNVTLAKRNVPWIFTPTTNAADDMLVTFPIPGISTNTFYFPTNTTYFASPVEVGRVHRSQPWKTIDFTGTHANSPADGELLSVFTIYNPMTAGNTNYLHGRININTGRSEFPVWAALFAGVPLWDGTWIDYSGGALGALTKTSNLATIVTSGKYYSPRDMVNLTNFANMSITFPTSGWPAQKSDLEREWLLNKTFNLVSTRGSGNFFNIWAWGQALKGSTNNETRMQVASETLIFAMVQSSFYTNYAAMPNNYFCDLRIVYFRYNPDLNFAQDVIDTAQTPE